MLAEIDGLHYRIEFSYFRRESSAIQNSPKRRKPMLLPDAPIEGVTGCTIVCDDNPRVVTMGMTVCSVGDPWTKQEGRKRAFDRAVRNCGLFRKSCHLFTAWYDEHFPSRPAVKLSETTSQKRALKRAIITLGVPLSTVDEFMKWHTSQFATPRTVRIGKLTAEEIEERKREGRLRKATRQATSTS